MKKNKLISVVICFSIFTGLMPVSHAQDINSRFSSLKNQCTQIKLLLSACEKSGIATDYERVSYRVIEKFIEYGLEDINNSKTQRAEYIADCLEKMASKTVSKLKNYRNGTNEPLSVDRYISSPARVDGYSVISSVKNNKTGEIKEKPVIFTGYGHFGTVAEDIEIMKDLGVNIIQQELVMYDCVVNPSSHPAEGWTKHEENMHTDIIRVENEGAEGTAALHFVNTASVESGKFTELRQTMYCEPSTKYTISIKSKGNTNSVYFLPDGWGSGSYGISGTDKYETTEISYTTSKNQRKMTFYLIIAGTSDFYIDDVSVKANGVEYVHNGNFEKPLKTYTSNGVTFGVDPTSAIHMSKNLERCEKADLKMDILLAPHYFPQYLINSAQNMSHTTSGVENFGANIYNELSKAAMKAYIDEVLVYFKDYKSLNSICISNEPGYTTKNSESYHKTQWSGFLQEKYGDIETLNNCYGKNTANKYSGFNFVPMTKTSDSFAPEYADWRSFNNKMFSDWHMEMASEIKNILPGIPVHVKVMNYIRYTDTHSVHGDYDRQFMDLGTDCEDFDTFSDFHGNDAHSYYNVEWAPFNSELLWYDYLSTISSKPVYNSEDHIIADKNKDYSPKQAIHYRANLWLGAIHGRTIQTSWVYQRTYDEDNLLSDSILDRPDVMEISGITSLDLNRLSEEVTALQNQTPEIAVWFSDNTRNYDRQHIDCLLSAYTAAISCGKRVSVVTDKQIENGKLNSEYKLLVIPGVSAVSEKALENVSTYLRNGGKAIRTGNCFVYDNWKKNLTSDNKQYVINNSITAGNSLFDSIISVLNTNDSQRVRAIDLSTGKDIENVDFRVVKQGSNYLINICRLDNINSSEIKKIKIVKGEDELKIKQDILNSENKAELYPFEPRLLLVDNPKNRDYEIKAVSKSHENIEEGMYSVTLRAKNTTGFWDMLKLNAILYDTNSNRIKSSSYKKGTPAGEFIEMTLSFKILADDCFMEISVSDRNDVVSKNKLIIK